jgi:long-chain acyl-CoA synthetase
MELSTVDIFLKNLNSRSPILPAIYFMGAEVTYGEFFNSIDKWLKFLETNGVKSGSICAIKGEFSPNFCSLMIALIKIKAISLPISPAALNMQDDYCNITGCEFSFTFTKNDQCHFEILKPPSTNLFLENFKKTSEPGLIVFSSGSTGTPKGILHSYEKLLSRHIKSNPPHKAILFLLPDHLGGINTFLSTLGSGGLIIPVSKRLPHFVCSLIQSSKATLLPTSPSFLNVLLSSKASHQFDISSIKLVTYGTEFMPESLLKKLRSTFPNAKFKQTYGLSELGVFKTKSYSDESTLIKIGDEENLIKIIDSVLWIKSSTSMIGYLNSKSPIDENGWLCTEDKVEVIGDYMRILGRTTDLINVGGEKVFPSEVEACILEDENVIEATVYGVANQVMGQVLHANVKIIKNEDLESFNKRIRLFLIKRLKKFQIPVKFFIEQQNSFEISQRFKKVRNQNR